MRSQTVLDFVIFQLTPTRTRYELYVVAGDVTEKLAAGLLKPFQSHLRAAEEQLKKGGYSIRLEPPDPLESSWFTKGTVERFVRFVSTPEVLERVSAVEMELVQLEETVKMQTSSSAQADDQFSIYSSSGSSIGLEKTGLSTKMRRDSIDSNETGVGENSKKQLLKALDSRRMVLQKEQDMAFACAAAAGFEMVHLMELIAFSDCFGAFRLREACIKFVSLHKKRQEVGPWVEETDFFHREGASIHSNRSITSIIKQRGSETGASSNNGHGINTNEVFSDLKVDFKSSFNGEGRINSGDEHFEIDTTSGQILLGYSTVDSRQVRAALAAREIGVTLDNATHSFLSISSNHSNGRHQPHGVELLLRHSKPAECFQQWSVNHAYRDSLCNGSQGSLPEVGLNGKECNDMFMQMPSSLTNGRIQLPRIVQDNHLPAEIRCLTERSSSPGQKSPLQSHERLQIGQGSPKHSGTVVVKNINYMAPSTKNNYKHQQENSSTESSKGAGSSSDDYETSFRSKVNSEQANAKNVIDKSEIRGSDKCQNFRGAVMQRWIDSPIFNADCSEKAHECDGRLAVREVEALYVNELSSLYGKERNGDSGKPANSVSDTKPVTTWLNKWVEVQNSIAAVAPKCSSEFHRSSGMSSHALESRWKDQLVTHDLEIGFAASIDSSCIKQQLQQDMSSIDDSFFVFSHSSSPERIRLEGGTTLSMESEMQGNKNQDLMVKRKMKGNSMLLNQEEPRDLFMVSSQKRESVKGNAANLDMQLLSGISDRQPSNHNISLNTQSKERVKRFLDRYNEKREAKRREESSSKRTERETKMKAMQDILEKRKSEMGMNLKLERAGSLAEAQLRADKLRAYKAGLQKSKKEKEEEERRRLEELKIQRRERIAARSKSSSFAAVSSTLEGHGSQRPKTTLSPANQLLSPVLKKAAGPVKSCTHGPSQLSSKQKCAKVKDSSALGLPLNLNRSSSIGVPKPLKNPLRNSAPSVTEFRKEVGRTTSTFSSTSSLRTIQTKSLNQHQSFRSPRDQFRAAPTCCIEGKKNQVSHGAVMTRATSGTEVKVQGLSSGKIVKDLSGNVRQQRVVRNAPEIKQHCRAFLKKGSGAASLARNGVPKTRPASIVKVVKQNMEQVNEGFPGSLKTGVPKTQAASFVKVAKQHMAQEKEGFPGSLQTAKVVTRHMKGKVPLLSVKTQIDDKENTRLKKKDQKVQMELFTPDEKDKIARRRPQVVSVRAFQQSGQKMVMSSSMAVEKALNISVSNDDEFQKADEPVKGAVERKVVQPCFDSAALSSSPEHDLQKHSLVDADLGISQVEVSYQEITSNPSTSALEKSPTTIDPLASAPAAFEEGDLAPIVQVSSDQVFEDAATTCTGISPEVSPVFDKARGSPSECQMKYDTTLRKSSFSAGSPISCKEQARGWKRLLRFGRRSIPSSKYGLAERALASTTSEGDEDGSEICLIRSRTMDDLGRKMNSRGNTSNLRASLNDMNFYSVPYLNFKGTGNPLPILPLKNPLSAKEARSERQNQGTCKGSTGKGPSSFFSFASFRGKSSEGKPH